MERELPVFVYGTLLNGFTNASRYVAPYGHRRLPAKARGRLYHLPQGYPALLAESAEDTWVTGELIFFESHHYVQAMKGLDELEDYFGKDDPRNLYEREVFHTIHPATNVVYPAFVYIMRKEQAELAKQQGIYLPGGDWRAYKLQGKK